jgi:hypothetical protein
MAIWNVNCPSLLKKKINILVKNEKNPYILICFIALKVGRIFKRWNSLWKIIDVYHLFLNFATGPFFTVTMATKLKYKDFFHFYLEYWFFFSIEKDN